MEEELNQKKAKTLNQFIRGKNITQILNITFAESLVGINKIITVNRYLMCTSCDGKRINSTSKNDLCKECGGVGSTPTSELCNVCFGTGLESIACSNCAGEG